MIQLPEHDLSVTDVPTIAHQFFDELLQGDFSIVEWGLGDAVETDLRQALLEVQESSALGRLSNQLGPLEAGRPPRRSLAGARDATLREVGLQGPTWEPKAALLVRWVERWNDRGANLFPREHRVRGRGLAKALRSIFESLRSLLGVLDPLGALSIDLILEVLDLINNTADEADARN